MTKRPYTYTVLRYIHDPVTGEFVNVGLVMHSPRRASDDTFLRGSTRHTIGRMRAMFPDLVRADFTSSMYAIDRAAGRLTTALGREGMLPSDGDALSFARQILPSDASSLQWSASGSGISADLNATFDKLFERFVSRYDDRAESRRSDDEVWRPVRTQLEQRGIPVQLEAKTISGGGDKIEFAHAWKNGSWHAYEAVSFDLAGADGIAEKAHRWLGRLTSVAPDAHEVFHTHFIVGKPSDSALESAYQRAVGILRKAPSADVYEESQIDAFVDRIEDEVRAHLA